MRLHRAYEPVIVQYLPLRQEIREMAVDSSPRNQDMASPAADDAVLQSGAWTAGYDNDAVVSSTPLAISATASFLVRWPLE